MNMSPSDSVTPVFTVASPKPTPEGGEDTYTVPLYTIFPLYAATVTAESSFPLSGYTVFYTDDGVTDLVCVVTLTFPLPSWYPAGIV